ncbi:hypothetical protein Hanom_Chr15g01355741 [Helianthus anomalus]
MINNHMRQVLNLYPTSTPCYIHTRGLLCLGYVLHLFLFLFLMLLPFALLSTLLFTSCSCPGCIAYIYKQKLGQFGTNISSSKYIY